MDIKRQYPDLLARAEEPFNAEPPLPLLRDEFVTPERLFFIRTHGPVPEVDPEQYRLSVDGMVREPLELSLRDLQERFTKQTIMATLQCAGNRRLELMEIAPIPGETPWDAGTISNGVWGGVPLREVLLAAGISVGARHLAFLGIEDVIRHGEQVGFGGSIPLEKGMSPEVLLAYEMNGEPLTPAHGYPLRVVTPGYIGARSVKWLARILVQAEPSENYFQAHAYKLFPPDVDAESADWAAGLMLGELSVNAVICRPMAGAVLNAGPVLVEGYAMAGGTRTIQRVDVTADGGKSWVSAELLGEPKPGVWRFWQAEVNLPEGQHELAARAWDSSANTQPEAAGPLWNFKGYMNNAWHRVTIRVGE
jgi:sulfite oxidase